MENDKRGDKAPAGPYSETLRAAIDQGRTGDKVAFPDPAAAPLGADDEAGGHTPDPQSVQMALNAEVVVHGATKPPVMGALMLMIAVIVFAGASFIAWGYMLTR